jgi:hypothetical protein
MPRSFPTPSPPSGSGSSSSWPSSRKLTLVYDTGNKSKASQALADALPVYYGTSLVPTQHPDFMAIPTVGYRPLEPGPLANRPVYRCRRVLWRAERTLVVFISPQLHRSQMRRLHQQLTQRLDALEQWQHTLAKPGSRPRTVASTQAGGGVGGGAIHQPRAPDYLAPAPERGQQPVVGD